MDINWLRDFVCLGRTLSFTRAADERHITQSAFSRRIKSLESWVGVDLIDRANYPVRLSDAGEQFLPVANDILVQLVESRQSIRDQDRGDKQFVRFAVLHTISVNYLADKISQLEQQIDRLRARVVSDSLGTCCQLLQEGSCDFLLCYRHPGVVLDLHDPGLQHKDIKTERLLPVAASVLLDELDLTLPGQAAEPIPYLAYERNSFLASVVEQTIAARKVHLDNRYMDGLVEAIKRRLLSGGGVAWMPESSIQDELARGELQQVGDDSWVAGMTLTLYCAPERLDATSQAVWDRF